MRKVIGRIQKMSSGWGSWRALEKKLELKIIKKMFLIKAFLNYLYHENPKLNLFYHSRLVKQKVS